MDLSKQKFKVTTSDRFDVVCVTEEVLAATDLEDVTDGLVIVTTPHTTAAVSINENERRLFEDMIEAFKMMVPPDAGYRHDRHHTATDTQPNAHAHIICAMLQTSIVLTCTDGTPDLGNWEDILLFEADGPSNRTVTVSVLS